MKTLAIVITCLMLGATIGFWRGKSSIPETTVEEIEFFVGTDIPQEFFINVNKGLPTKLMEYLGHSGDAQCHVLITPTEHGYRIKSIAPQESPLWEATTRKDLDTWIHSQYITTVAAK